MRTIKVVLVLLLMTAALFPFWQQQGQIAIEKTMKQAMITFASARALNGVISVIQETEIAVQPAGVGIGVEPGQILDPLNDLIETFSNLMLVSSVVLGVMLLMGQVTAQWWLKSLLVVSVVNWLYVLWRKESWKRNGYKKGPFYQSWEKWSANALSVLLIVSLIIPTTFILSDYAGKWVLQQPYQNSQQAIQTTQTQLQSITIVKEQPSEQSWSDKMSDWYDQAAQFLDVKRQIQELKQSSERAVEHSLTLMVIFVIKVMLIPLLIAGFVLIMIRKIINPRSHYESGYTAI